ncbi:MAG: hypothetical protein JSS72_04650 [Armatimonadetes bacterium]|nr:hypothetical protein [Armatimonadota bacterium]
MNRTATYMYSYSKILRPTYALTWTRGAYLPSRQRIKGMFARQFDTPISKCKELNIAGLV